MKLLCMMLASAFVAFSSTSFAQQSECASCRQAALTKLQTCLARAGNDAAKKKACNDAGASDSSACDRGACRAMMKGK